MKYFSPIFFNQFQFKMIETAFYNMANPIVQTLPYYGEVRFIPVRVCKRTDKTFEPYFIANRAPTLDIPALDRSVLTYVFDEHGDYNLVQSRKKMVSYSALYGAHLAKDIRIPDCLEDGDIILCSHAIPERLR